MKGVIKSLFQPPNGLNLRKNRKKQGFGFEIRH
jgi:hypothetical protein